MKIFIEDNAHTDTRSVTATVEGVERKYRAARLTRFGGEQMVGALTDQARFLLGKIIEEGQAAGKSEKLINRELDLHSWAILERAAPILASDVDGTFGDYDELFALMDSVEGSTFVDNCAEAALSLNPQLNPARADFFQRRRAQEAGRSADFLAVAVTEGTEQEKLPFGPPTIAD